MTAIAQQRPTGPASGSGFRYPLARDGLPDPGPAAVTIRLLGRFAVDRGGQEVALPAFGGRLARRLLRLLALRRGSLVPKDLIAEALWPKDPPADAAGNIEVLVSRIRGALGDRTLVRAGPGGYVLADDGRCRVDTEAFAAAVQEGRAALAARPAEALGWFRAALDIWRGEPLAEDTYAEWAQADRRLLCQAFLEALEGAAAAALSLTDAAGGAAAAAADAASWARQALAAEPLRETAVLLLVRALAADGDRAGALAAFDDYRDRLASETGLDPTPQARDLRQRILTSQSAPPAEPERRVTAGPAGSRCSFLGRERECAVIADAAAGRGPRVVLVTGASGIGKSALLAEAARRAAVPVLSARAFPADQDAVWSLAGRLLRQAAARLPGPAAEVLAEPEASALAEVVPGLSGPPGAVLAGRDEEDRRALAFRGAIRLVAAVARPRCLIAADDLQWADPASLTLLGLLIRTFDGVSLAAACRPAGDVGLAAAGAFGMPAGEVTTIMLDPLPDGAVRDLFGDRLLAEAMLRQAGGSPFTVTEVAAALARQGAIARGHDQRWRLRPARGASEVAEVVAAGLREAARSRVAGLPARSRDMLGLLARLGRPAPAALLAAAGGVGLRAALDTLEGLAGAGLARAGTQGWALSHELAGQAIRGTMSPAGTTRAHALLAAALQECGGDPAEIAGHLAAGGDREGAATAYAAAARSQLERISDREAERLAEAGLSLDPPGRTRAALLEVRGEAGRRGGRLEAARSDFTAALDSLDDPASRSGVLACLAILDARTAGAARGGELAELAIAEAGRQPDTLGQALAAGAIIDLTGGNLARAHERWHRARRLLEAAGDSRGGARLLYWQAMASFTGGRLADAVSQLGQLAGLPAGHGEILRLWSPRATRGHALAFLGRAADGLAEIDEVLAWARAAGHRAVEAECLWRRSEALAIGGRAGEAIEAAGESAAIATGIGHAEWTAAAHRGLGVACEAAGLSGRAESAYRRSAQDSGDLPFFRAWAEARLGACLARRGQPGEAAPHVRAALAGGTPLTRFEARWAHAELLASRGEDEARRAVAAAALEAARHGGYLILVPRLRELAG
jgi:DNA-binding SARP family transcriptional activator